MTNDDQEPINLESEETTEAATTLVVACPDCDHEIAIDPDWQEGDQFSCQSCSVDLQVTGLDPIMIDFAPDNDDDWEDSDEIEPLSLDDDDEIESDDDDDDDDDEDGWGGQSARRAVSLRVARLRMMQRREPVDVSEDGPVTFLTPEGAERLQRELGYLQSVRIPKVTAWLADALSEGFEDEDVTELEEARSELSFIEGRIRNIEAVLMSAQLLAEPETREMVQLGSRVTVVEGGSEPETYRIVSPAETDPLTGFISDRSPLGRALMGRKVGDVVTVESPDGPIQFQVADIA